MNVPLSEIKDYLSKAEMPDTFNLNDCTFIINTKEFISTSFAQLERNKGNRTYLTTYRRLNEFYLKMLEIQNKK